MVKYSPELKTQIVNKYLSTLRSAYTLSEKYQIRGRWSAGYCCIQAFLDKLDFYLSGDIVCKLMRELNVQVSLCNRHRNGKYSSYRGTVG